MMVVLASCSVPSWLSSFVPTIWAAEQPDSWQCCRLLEPSPARGAQRALGQKASHRFFVRPLRPTQDVHDSSTSGLGLLIGRLCIVGAELAVARKVLMFLSICRIAFFSDQERPIQKHLHEFRRLHKVEMALVNTQRGSSARVGAVERANYGVERQSCALRLRLEESYFGLLRFCKGHSVVLITLSQNSSIKWDSDVPHVLQLRHLRSEWVVLPVISALNAYFLTDELSTGGPADSASSHLISSHRVVPWLIRYAVCSKSCRTGRNLASHSYAMQVAGSPASDSSSSQDWPRGIDLLWSANRTVK